VTAVKQTTGVHLALSRRDAAKALGLSLSSFQRYVQPDVRCVYVGQLRLYRVPDLQAWLDRQSCQGGRAA
jgi:hypothetical protein